MHGSQGLQAAGAHGAHWDMALAVFIMTTSPELAALMTRGPAAAYSASLAFEPPRTAGIRDPLRVKQLDPLLQPTKIGEASNAINENVITFFIFCAICRPKPDLNQCGVTIKISRRPR